MSSWRENTNYHLAVVFAELKREGITDADEINRRIYEAYPFGERNYFPYKVWLEQVKKWKAGYAMGLRGPTGQDAPPRKHVNDPAQGSLI